MNRTGTVPTDTRRSGDWRFWGGWGIAFVGFPLGGLAASALVRAASALAGDVGPVAEGVLAGAVAGAVVGAAQWLVLSRRLPLSPWWVAATSAGMAVGMALGIGLLGTDGTESAVLLRALATGAGVGLAQTLVLRDVTNRAPAWGVVVTTGWVLGWVISTAVGVDLGPWAVFGATGAWAFQLLTGLTLAWLLRRAYAVSPRLVVAA